MRLTLLLMYDYFPRMAPNPTSLSERFSAQVRAHLAFHRLTVADLAAGTLVSEATLYRRLNDGKSWPLDQAAAVATWCGYDSLGDMLRAGIQTPVGAA